LENWKRSYARELRGEEAGDDGLAGGVNGGGIDVKMCDNAVSLQYYQPVGGEQGMIGGMEVIWKSEKCGRGKVSDGMK
jgi:hypothetical protein